VVRRTGTIAPAPEPEKSNVLATVLAAIFLLAVIVFGAQRIRPIFQAARQQNRGYNSGYEVPQTQAASDPAVTDSTVSTPAPNPSSSFAKSAERAAVVTTNSLSPAAAEYKDQILQIATERHLRDRLSVKGSGMTLTLSGKLRPVEHSELLKFLRNAPASIQVTDDIRDATTNTASSSEDSSKHQGIQPPPLAPGLLVTSEPAGADIFINGDKQSGQTPMTLPLKPGKYNVVLRLPGYDAYSGSVQLGDDGQAKIETALHQKSGHVAWAQVESTPAGAEIWVDGVATGERTPARIEISSGIHNIALKLEGYRASHSAIQASEGGTVNVSPSLQRIR
jgi:hypothetical protein